MTGAALWGLVLFGIVCAVLGVVGGYAAGYGAGHRDAIDDVAGAR